MAVVGAALYVVAHAVSVFTAALVVVLAVHALVTIAFGAAMMAGAISPPGNQAIRSRSFAGPDRRRV